MTLVQVLTNRNVSVMLEFHSGGTYQELNNVSLNTSFKDDINLVLEQLELVIEELEQQEVNTIYQKTHVCNKRKRDYGVPQDVVSEEKRKKAQAEELEMKKRKVEDKGRQSHKKMKKLVGIICITGHCACVVK